MTIKKLTLGKPIRYPNSHGDVWTATVVARATDHFEATMKYGETGIWKME